MNRERYQEILRKDPRSQVFALLADDYRKLGLYDKAFKILKEGVRFNPSYFPGHLVLGRCYCDKGYYDSALLAVRPFIDSHKDNLSFLKLLSEIYLKLEMKESALSVFQSIIFLDPRNQEAKKRIQQLQEPQMAKQQTAFDVSQIAAHPEGNDNDIDQWHIDSNHLSPSFSSISTKEKLTLFLHNIQKRYRFMPLPIK